MRHRGLIEDFLLQKQTTVLMGETIKELGANVPLCQKGQQSGTWKCSGVGPCVCVCTCLSSPGWGTHKPRGPQSWKGTTEHPGSVKFSLCLQEPVPG